MAAFGSAADRSLRPPAAALSPAAEALPLAPPLQPVRTTRPRTPARAASRGRVRFMAVGRDGVAPVPCAWRAGHPETARHGLDQGLDRVGPGDRSAGEHPVGAEQRRPRVARRAGGGTSRPGRAARGRRVRTPSCSTTTCTRTGATRTAHDDARSSRSGSRSGSPNTSSRAATSVRSRTGIGPSGPWSRPCGAGRAGSRPSRGPRPGSHGRAPERRTRRRWRRRRDRPPPTPAAEVPEPVGDTLPAPGVDPGDHGQRQQDAVADECPAGDLTQPEAPEQLH